jgi:hypothetical protein
MPVFNARGVSAQEAAAFFDVTLTEVLGVTKFAKFSSNLHDSLGCGEFDCGHRLAWGAETGTASKYQIANGKYDEGQQDSGGHGDQHPTAEAWPRSGERQQVRGQVWWIEGIGWELGMSGTRHEDRLAFRADTGTAVYRISTHDDDWPIR